MATEALPRRHKGKTREAGIRNAIDRQHRAAGWPIPHDERRRWILADDAEVDVVAEREGPGNSVMTARNVQNRGVSRRSQLVQRILEGRRIVGSSVTDRVIGRFEIDPARKRADEFLAREGPRGRVRRLREDAGLRDEGADEQQPGEPRERGFPP